MTARPLTECADCGAPAVLSVSVSIDFEPAGDDVASGALFASAGCLDHVDNVLRSAGVWAQTQRLEAQAFGRVGMTVEQSIDATREAMRALGIPDPDDWSGHG